MGLAYSIAAFGALIGNPIAGACLKEDAEDAQTEFQGPWFFAGSFMLLATGCLAFTRYLKVGFRLRVKI